MDGSHPWIAQPSSTVCRHPTRLEGNHPCCHNVIHYPHAMCNMLFELCCRWYTMVASGEQPNSLSWILKRPPLRFNMHFPPNSRLHIGVHQLKNLSSFFPTRYVVHISHVSYNLPSSTKVHPSKEEENYTKYLIWCGPHLLEGKNLFITMFGCD